MLLEVWDAESNFNSVLQIEICVFSCIFFPLRVLQNLHSSKANFLAPFLVPVSEKKSFEDYTQNGTKSQV